MSLQRTSLALGLFAAALSLAACNKASDGASTAKGSENAADPNTADMPDFGGVEVVAVKVDGVGPSRNAAIFDGLNLAVRQVNGVPLAGPRVSWAQLFSGGGGAEALLEFDMGTAPVPWGQR